MMNFLSSITNSQELQQLSLSEYWHVVRKRKRIAITFFIISVFSTTFYSLVQPKIYKATTNILIERGGKNILSFQDVFSVQTAGLDYYPTQHKVLRSRSIAKRVMDDLNLWPQYQWASDPIQAFLRDIEISPIKESRLVDVSAYAKNPKLAADIANGIVKFYIAQNLDNKLAATQQAADWIQGKIGEIRDKLNKSELQLEVLKLKKELAKLNEKYLPKHPEVIRTETQLKMLEKQLDEESLRNLSRGEVAVQYNDLKREVESNRKIYESMLGRLKETLAAEGVEDTNVVVVDRAEIPKKQVAPRVLLNIFLGILVGFFGGVGLCLVFESLDDTLKSPEDVEKKARLPVLGVIGKWNTNKMKLIVHDDPISGVAEAFRAIRTSLLFSSPDKPIRTFLITSPRSEEGKTTVAANLAATLAQNGSNVLLVDADMRKPRLHTIFNYAGGDGLSHALSNAHSPLGLIQRTSIDHLSVLFSGPIPPTPSEMLGSQKMRHLVDTLRQHFDYVIFDAPPFTAVTDPVILSSFLDGVILVARYDKTPKDILMKGKQKFLDVGARILGVVVNAVDFKQESYRYASYSYSHYGDYKLPKKAKTAKPVVAVQEAPSS